MTSPAWEHILIVDPYEKRVVSLGEYVDHWKLPDDGRRCPFKDLFMPPKIAAALGIPMRSDKRFVLTKEGTTGYKEALQLVEEGWPYYRVVWLGDDSHLRQIK